MEDKQCQTRVWGAYSTSWQCRKKVVTERDGEFYCKIHDPVYIKEKNRKWRENFDKEMVENRKKWHRHDVIQKVCEPYSTEWLEAHAKDALARAETKND